MGVRSMERHEMIHGPAGGWEMFEAFGLFLGVLFLLGLLALAAWGAYRLIGKLQVGAHVDSAESILRERFARGEIPASEYEETLEILRRHPLQEEDSVLTTSADGGRKRYEEYVREAMNRLRFGRRVDS